MKKIVYMSLIIGFALISSSVFATEFSDALRTCSPFLQKGDAVFQSTIYNIEISLDKKGNKCLYKEKIAHNQEYQTLDCSFNMSELNGIAKSMDDYYNYNKKALDRNKIFQAKMTSNGIVFQQYLANPKYCKVSAPKKI